MILQDPNELGTTTTHAASPSAIELIEANIATVSESDQPPGKRVSAKENCPGDCRSALAPGRETGKMLLHFEVH
jgi:hypothetical protein